MPRCLLKLVLIAALAAACGGAPPLANTQASPEALASAVLDALARRDRTTLEWLALSEREFRDHVWPELPAARPERNLPFSYVWGDLRQKSRLGLSRTLEQHGGRRHDLVRVAFDGETSYTGYRVHRAATFVVRDGSAAEVELHVIGSMIVKDGGWKVFSYVVED